MPQTYAFVPKEDADRLGLLPREAVNAYTLADYKLKGIKGFPFVPTPRGDEFRDSAVEEAYRRMEEDTAFVKIVVYNSN